ncbi:MAG: major intrinsic protein [Candidatus Saccharibacteria bacterium]|nr:major intrinsic protein [Candidatus Saccharibacteria bacterium]
MTVRSKIAMLVAEFLGTGILATAIINVARSQIGIGYFVAFSAAITYLLLTLVFSATSGAHFNPAVTIGMWTLRKIQTLQALAYLAAQMLGGLAAWRLAEYFTGQKLASIASKSFEWKVFVAEMLGTLVFTFGITAAIYQKFEGAKMAATAGASLFVGVVVASLASNAALNPAVALANQTWGRADIFGPIVGAVVGMNLYALLFAPSTRVAASSSAATTTSVAPARRKTAATAAKRKPAAKPRTTARRKTTTARRTR